MGRSCFVLKDKLARPRLLSSDCICRPVGLSGEGRLVRGADPLAFPSTGFHHCSVTPCSDGMQTGLLAGRDRPPLPRTCRA